MPQKQSPQDPEAPWPKGSMEGGALWGWDLREGCVQSGEAHLLFPSSPSPFTEVGPHASPSYANPYPYPPHSTNAQAQVSD